MKNNILILISVLVASLILVSGCSYFASSNENVYIEFDNNESLNITSTELDAALNDSINNTNSSLTNLYNSFLNGSLNYTNSSNGHSYDVSYPGGRVRIYLGGGGGSSGGGSGSSGNNDQNDSNSQEQNNDSQDNETNSTDSQNSIQSDVNQSINETQDLNQSINDTQYNETQSGDNENQSNGNDSENDNQEGNDEDSTEEYSVGPFCGDGNLDQGEQCDDGGNVNGDGCSANCEEEELTEQVPEFTTIGAGLVLAGAGYFIYKKRGKI